MRTQKTIQRNAEEIVNALTTRRGIGTRLSDIYERYSQEKQWHYDKCYGSIQLGARNIDYGVYACGSWSFVFLAKYDIETVDCENVRHDLTVYKRFTRDTTTCIVYDWNTHTYYDAYSFQQYFDLKIKSEGIHILYIVDGLEG